MIVDLPMPGAPPISTSEPGTMPPPSTRSSSPMPVLKRGECPAATSASGTGFAALAGAARDSRAPALTGSATRSSTIVFHSSQPGQRPCHLGLALPHCEQTKSVFGIPPR